MDTRFCLDGDSTFDRNREKRRMVTVSVVFAFGKGLGTREVLAIIMDDGFMILVFGAWCSGLAGAARCLAFSFFLLPSCPSS